MHYQRFRRDGTLDLLTCATLAERVWAKIERKPDGCWHWTGSRLSNGYGVLGPEYAHRAVYELLVGPISDGQELDHLCHNADLACPGGWECLHRRCVNPSHLEPVSPTENRQRGQSVAAVNLRKTHCPLGHPLDGANLYVRPSGWRECRTCRHARRRSHYELHRVSTAPYRPR